LSDPLEATLALCSIITSEKREDLKDVLTKSAEETLSQVTLQEKVIRDLQWKDPQLRVYVNYLKYHRLPTSDSDCKMVLLTHDYYFLSKGVLFKIHIPPATKSSEAKALLCVPQNLKKIYLSEHHDSQTGGHTGCKRMISVMCDRFYWRGMITDIKNYVASCQVCSESKPGTTTLDFPMNIRDPAPAPMTYLTIDTMKMTPTRRGNLHVCVVSDMYSRYTVAWPTPDITAETIAAQFYHRIICVFGSPIHLQSDNGSCFVADMYQSMCKKFGIKQVFSTAYNPKSNGLVERTNRTILGLVKAYCDKKQRKWDDYLNPLVFAINTSVSHAIGLSPFMLQFGRAPRLIDEAQVHDPLASEFSSVQTHITNTLTTQL